MKFTGDQYHHPQAPVGLARILPFHLGSLRKGLGFSPVRLYELFSYVSGVLVS